MAEPTIKISADVGDATRQIDAFGVALSRVDQKARGIFNTLQNLSQQYQQEGFLGTGNQRQLERSMEQWRRATEVLGLQRTGAEARVAQRRADLGTTPTPAAIGRLGQAESVLQRLTLHQEGMAALRQRLGNLYAGRVPSTPVQAMQMAAGLPPTGVLAGGAFTAWLPGMQTRLGPGGFSFAPLQGGPGGLSGTTPQYLGRYSPWAPGMQAQRGPGGWTTMAPVSMPGGLSGTTPQYLGPHTPWTPGMQTVRGPGGWTTTIPVGGPPSGQPSGGAGFLGALLGGILGGGGVGSIVGGAGGALIGGPLGAIVGSKIGGWGDKALQTVTGRAEREVGILRLGDTLQQQFGDLRGTMVAMRREYQVLGQEGVNAMMSLARATGLVEQTSTMAAVGVGRFYGMTAEESLGTVAQFRMAGILDPNLASVTAVGSAVAARHPGSISTARFLASEAPMIATAGGFAAEPMRQPMPERYGEYIAQFGPRYAAQPGAAYLARAQRLTQPTGTLGQVLQVQALDQLRHRQRYVRWGYTVLDLNNPEDFRVAQENIGQIADVEEAIGQQAALHAGGNETLQRFYYGRATGATATEARAEVRGMRAYAQQYGGIAAGLGRPVNTVAEKAAIDARKTAEQGEVGLNVLRARTTPEEISELAPIRAYLASQLALTNAVGTTAQAFNELNPFIRELTDELRERRRAAFALGEAQTSLEWQNFLSQPDQTQQQPHKPQ